MLTNGIGCKTGVRAQLGGPPALAQRNGPLRLLKVALDVQLGDTQPVDAMWARQENGRSAS